MSSGCIPKWRPPAGTGRSRPCRPSLLASCTLPVLLCFILVRAARAEAPPVDFVSPAEVMDLDIEDLLSLRVVSASKKEEILGETSAAIYVITAEDIRRSGATDLPEALRLAPGLQVNRVDKSKWAVSSRGFNSRFADKLLVLMDGRSLFTPLFSGVFWDVQDTMIEDIDRIEVIRGPGATLWGTNAVNGVINIITKHASETQGGLAVLGTGSERRPSAAARYGASIGEAAYFRLYAKTFSLNEGVDAAGRSTGDGRNMLRTGFRWDWRPSLKQAAIVQGSVYTGENDLILKLPNLTPPYQTKMPDEEQVEGGHLLFRYRHELSPSSDLSLQLTYDRTKRELYYIGETRDTVNCDFQHRFATVGRQDVLWGFGYQFTTDHIRNTPMSSFTPPSRSDDRFSCFVQDTLHLVPDRLTLSAGTKLEHNNYSGFEFQPSVRLYWKADAKQSVWAAISRAVTPSYRGLRDARSEDSVILDPFIGVFPVLIVFVGDEGYDSENLTAYEVGYRARPARGLLLDLALFYNVYDNLITLELNRPYAQTSPRFHLVQELRADNKREADAYGLEIVLSWDPTDWWRLTGNYAYLYTDVRLDSDSTDPLGERQEGENPRNQFQVSSRMTLPHNLELDTSVRYVDSLPTLFIPSYVGLDARLGWRPTNSLELSLSGRDLLEDHHPEMAPFFSYTKATESQRSLYASLTCRF